MQGDEQKILQTGLSRSGLISVSQEPIIKFVRVLQASWEDINSLKLACMGTATPQKIPHGESAVQ